MFKKAFGSLAAVLLLSTYGPAATADFAPGDELLEAEVVDVNRAERTLTVEFENGGMVETYPVAESAEFWSYDGVLRRPRMFTDIIVGQTVDLEFGGIEGEVTLNKVTSRDGKSDS